MRIAALQNLGFTEEAAISLMSDYNAWLKRPEIVGKNNIAEGAESVGHQVEKRYGYYGKTADYSGPFRATCPDFERHHSGV